MNRTTAESQATREYAFGDYRIDLAAYQLWQGSRPIALTPKVFDTLVVLIQNRDRAVSKEELLSLVWPDSTVTEDSLAQSVSMLRKALGDDTTHPRLIATIARRGYRFIGEVTEVSSDPLPSEAESKAPSSFSSSALQSEPSFAPPEGNAARVSRENSAFGKWKHWFGGALLGGAAVVAIGLAIPQVFSLHRVVGQTSLPLQFSVGASSASSRLLDGVLSPDGRSVLLLVKDAGSEMQKISIRSLVTGQTWSIAGTEGATRPFWSPDSRLIGFIQGGKLERVGINNQTAPQVITTIDTRTEGLTWSSKGVIVFAPRGAGLYSVPDSGGEPAPLTTLNLKEQEVAHVWPQFLPDGNHFLYFADSSKAGQRGTYLGSLDSKQAERVIDVPAVFAPPGYLIYPQNSVFRVRALDLRRPQATQKLIGEIMFPTGSADEAALSTSNLSVSVNGLLAYVGTNTTPQIKSLDRSGHELSSVDMSMALYSPALSPDQNQLLVASRGPNSHGVWLVDLRRGVSTRIIEDGRRSLWSPDGMQIVFSADRGGAHSFFVRPAAASNEDKLLLTAPYAIALNDWSRDGRYILYTTYKPNSKNELWILPMSGDHTPKPFLRAASNEMQGEISPDGRWVAYVSDESGRWEVYLQSFPEPTTARILSTGGGGEPHWRKDGKELYYLAPDRSLMAVPITLSTRPEIERPRLLFRAPLSSSSIVSNKFAVSSDGQRFVMVSDENAGATGEQVTVLSSWLNLLSH